MLGNLTCFVFILNLFVYLTYGNIENVNASTHRSVASSLPNNFVQSTTSKVESSTLKAAQVPVQDLTHNGREHVKDLVQVNSSIKIPSSLITHNETSALTSKMADLYLVGEKNDGKPVVPKKGVVYEPPTLKLEVNMNGNKSQTSFNHLQEINHNNSTTNEEILRSNFVLPIVAVVLSVPLVTILFIVFYKRGAEWWQHRHYKQMDFLIDGMYNS